MKKHHLPLLAVALGLATATTSQASFINWSAPQAVTAESDVSTDGSLVGAFKLTGAPITVNTVPFQSLSLVVGNTSVTSGNFTLTSPAINTVTTNAGPPGVSAAYFQLLNDAATSFSPLTLSMGGLVTGKTYQFEWWSNESAFAAVVGHPITTALAGNAVTLDSNPSGVLGGYGQFATGTFVADATQMQSITFTSRDNVLVNAFQLRKDSPVPEPSTWMMGIALCIPALLGSRRRLITKTS